MELFKLLPNWRSFRKVLNRTILTTFVFLFLQIKRKTIKNPGKSTGDLPDFLSAFLNRSCPYEIQEPDLSCDRWYFTLPLCETRVWSEKVHKTKHSHTQKHWQTNTDSTLIIIHHPLISIITWSSRDETEQQGSRSLEAGSCERRYCSSDANILYFDKEVNHLLGKTTYCIFFTGWSLVKEAETN